MNSQKPGSRSKDKQTLSQRTASQQKKARRYILIFLTIIIGITALFLALMGAVSHFTKEEEESGGTLLFYEPDYDLDIMQNKEYLGLDRDIRFENPENGITVAIIDGNMDEVPSILHDSVGLICNFIDYAIHGETELLNSLFSQEYIEADGKVKMDFTMQQLYNIKITYITSSSVEVDGFTHVSHDYWLEYMIHKNNGTFRNDMESDCTRKEYVRVTDRNGILGIDILAPYKVESPNTKSDFGNRFVTMLLISTAIVGCSSIGCMMILKHSKKRK